MSNNDILKKFIGESLLTEDPFGRARSMADIAKMKSVSGVKPGQRKPQQAPATSSPGGDVSESPFLDQEFIRGAGQILMNPNMHNRLDKMVGQDKVNSVMRIVKALYDSNDTMGSFAENFGQIVMKNRIKLDKHLGSGLIDKIFGILHQDYKSRRKGQ